MSDDPLNRLERIETALECLREDVAHLLDGMACERMFGISLGHHLRTCQFCTDEKLCAVATAMVKEFLDNGFNEISSPGRQPG